MVLDKQQAITIYYKFVCTKVKAHIDGLVQERRTSNSIAYTLELHFSCTNPSTIDLWNSLTVFFSPKNERHFNFHYWMSYITWFWQPDKSDKHGSKLQFRLLDCKIYLEMSSSMWLVSDPVLSNSTQHNQHMQQRPYLPGHTWYILRADSRLVPSQWETSLQSNAISHWMGANLESALYSVPDVSSQDLLYPCDQGAVPVMLTKIFPPTFCILNMVTWEKLANHCLTCQCLMLDYTCTCIYIYIYIYGYWR